MRELAVAIAVQLKGTIALGEPVRALVDAKATKASAKRWQWVKKGAPLIVEIGPRDMAAGNVTTIRRDALYDDKGKLASVVVTRDAFIADVATQLLAIQTSLFEDARARRDAAMIDVADWPAIEAHFTDDEDEVKGWVVANWSRPDGAALAEIAQRLKRLKLTVRNTLDTAVTGPCLFTGAPATERVVIGRTY